MSQSAENLEKVLTRILNACESCGRDPGEVALLAVSKKQDVDAIRSVMQAGQLLFGENRVQEAMIKQPELPGSLKWHLIGHLQSNKVKQAVHCRFECIHSVDSVKLLRMLNREAADQGWVQKILLQVNVSGEGSKSGIRPEELVPLLEEAAGCMNLNVDGLMTIPPVSEDPEKAAPHFARLRELRDDAAARTGFPLSFLSMGMSHDMEVAIREGASMVRIGTDIFGKRS